MLKYLLILGLCLPVAATELIHFVDIEVEHQGADLILKTQPKVLFSHKQVRDERYFLGTGVYNALLDAPFRQTVFLLRNVERNRASLFKKGKKNHELIKFNFELTVRKDTGEELETLRYETVAGLAAEPGMGFVACKQANFIKTFPLTDLASKDPYLLFLQDIIFPFDEKKITAPKGDAFGVDLYYRWPEVGAGLAGNKRVTLQGLTPKELIWEYGEDQKPKRHLGTTYAHRSKGQWTFARSSYFQQFHDVVDLWSQVLAAHDNGDLDTALPLLETYVKAMPGDRNGLMLLRNYYVEDDRNQDLLDLLTRFKGIYAAIPDSMEILEDLEDQIRGRRNRLLGKRATFQKSRQAVVEITSPEHNDLVSGSSVLTFTVSDHPAPILAVEAYLDDELLVCSEKAPFKAPFNTGPVRSRRQLRVAVWFEDETWQEASISIKTMRVDNEDRIRVVPIQATVFQTGKGRDLTKEDFKISENKKDKEAAWFYKNDAPLRITVLLDTSLSMNGAKLHKAQYTIKTFLSKLAPDDRISVYAFDNKVMKISDFTADFDELAPSLMTLSPHGATSLYDAMYIAQDALEGQNGTRVMIVISDGEDSTSTTTDLQTARILKNSQTMVYTIALPGDEALSDMGNRFLAEMSRTTGCVFTKLESLNHLDQTFDRIYQDLRNLYYLGYYSELGSNDTRDVRVKAKPLGAKVRHRILEESQIR